MKHSVGPHLVHVESRCTRCGPNLGRQTQTHHRHKQQHVLTESMIYFKRKERNTWGNF